MQTALAKVDARLCFQDFHKVQGCPPMGRCTINFDRQRFKPVPNACTAEDRQQALAFDSRPATCIQGGDGQCSLDWSDPDQCSQPPKSGE